MPEYEINGITAIIFNDINIGGEYCYAISNLRENEDNPTAPPLRFVIAFAGNEVQELIDMGTRKHVDNLDISIVDIKDFLGSGISLRNTLFQQLIDFIIDLLSLVI